MDSKKPSENPRRPSLLPGTRQPKTLALGAHQEFSEGFLARTVFGKMRAIKPLISPFGFILLCGLLVYHNILYNGFHLDDHYGVVDNPGIASFWPPWRHFLDPRTISSLERVTQYRPLLPLTLSINHALFGQSLPAYHLFNLGVHLGAAMLLYVLCLEWLIHWPGRPRSRSSRKGMALVVAALFVVHPVSGILVNYIVARDLALMEFFLLAALLSYTRMRRLGSTLPRWTLVVIFFSLSMLSKTNPVAAPVVVFFFEILLAKEPISGKTPWLRALPFTGLVALFFGFTRYGLEFSDLEQVTAATSLFSLEYLLTQFHLHLLHYGRNFVWPFYIRPMPAVDLADSVFEPRVAAGILLVAITLWGAWKMRQSHPLLSFCILSYWTLLIPTSSFLPLHFPAADYRPYPASPFFFLGIVLVAGSLLDRKALRLAGAALGIAYFGLASVYLNRTWRNGETLWTHSVRHGGNATAHHGLAMSLSDRRDPRVRHHLEEALRLSPNYVLAQVNLGLLRIQLGEIEPGLAHCRKAVEIAPHWGQPYYWLAQAYTALGRVQEAAGASRRAAELDPRNLKYRLQAALHTLRLGDYKASLRYLEAIEAQAGAYGNSRFLAGIAHQMMGDHPAAIQAYRVFIDAHPTHSQAHFNLAYVLMQEGDCRAAVPHFETTLRLRPDYAKVHPHLADCYARLGDKARAGTHLKRARRNKVEPPPGAQE